MRLHALRSNPEIRRHNQRMFLLPVAYAAMGMTTYSLLLFFATLSPLEIQFLCAILNVVTAGTTACAIFHFLPTIVRRLERVESMLEIEEEEEEEETSSVHSSSSSASSSSSNFTVLDRSVEERDGKLIITTILGPAEAELRELVESPSEPELTEETAEFAELLEGMVPSADQSECPIASTNTNEKKDN
jgi:hypothetical protein